MRGRHSIYMARSPKFDVVWRGSLNLIFAALLKRVIILLYKACKCDSGIAIKVYGI
jgi:hypothetical protein